MFTVLFVFMSEVSAVHIFHQYNDGGGPDLNRVPRSFKIWENKLPF